MSEITDKVLRGEATQIATLKPCQAENYSPMLLTEKNQLIGLEEDGVTGMTIKGETVTEYVTVTVAEMLALDSVPKILIPAQGAGTVIEFVSLFVYTVFNSVPYATAGTFTVQVGDQYTSSDADPFTANSAKYYLVPIDINNTANSTRVLDNRPLTLSATNAVINGDSALILAVSYRVKNFN